MRFSKQTMLRTAVAAAACLLTVTFTQAKKPGGGGTGGGGNSPPAGIIYYNYSPDLIAMNADGSDKHTTLVGIGDAEPSIALHNAKRWFLHGFNGLAATSEDNVTVPLYAAPANTAIYAMHWVNDPEFGADTYVSWYEVPEGATGEDGTLILAPVVYDMDGDISGLDMTFAEFFDGLSWDLDWSPDGTAVAYRVGDELWIYDTLSDQHALLPPSISFEPKWSPDGSRIAYAAVYENLTTIETIDVSSLSITVVAKARNHGVNGSYVDRPNWSPTGEYLLYRFTNANGYDWYYDIMRCTADGKSPTNLTGDVTLSFIHSMQILGWRQE